MALKKTSKSVKLRKRKGRVKLRKRKLTKRTGRSTVWLRKKKSAKGKTVRRRVRRRRSVLRPGRKAVVQPPVPSPAEELTGTDAYQEGYNETYQEGFNTGFAQGFEDGHKLAYQEQENKA
ncbi:hypothetical protein AWM70_14090 [Paenibacillus yonginensis]|uniref:Uncharacterized protein n=1 Tax=Paenibacillus yonginensis TaxID=1462996 RepID=A0A1B1N2E6_9BACL|nr:hypothetical protein [Paenibacillus yonginensis]ANS75588.1 hypothetical protein AWM70_14090 [Paenibacillus yonginensis]